MSKMKLKPCPFCGSPGVIRYIPVFIMPYFAECSNELCPAGNTGVSFFTSKEAAAAWNRRVKNECRIQESGIRPKDKQLCIIVSKATGIPQIGIYLEDIKINRYSSEIGDYFLDVCAVMRQSKLYSCDSPSFHAAHDIRYWQPVNLPENVTVQILEEVEKLFREDSNDE